jgi:hypothetical protein
MPLLTKEEKEFLPCCLQVVPVVIDPAHTNEDCYMAKRVKKSVKRRSWTKGDHRALKAHSKARTPVAKISKMMKRTVGALRQQALKLGIGLGHQR